LQQAGEEVPQELVDILLEEVSGGTDEESLTSSQKAELDAEDEKDAEEDEELEEESEENEETEV